MKNKNKQTKFPVARIKKIMQKDEEVGKVAQATPVVISKALELFLTMIVEESAKVTVARGARKVEAYHLKHAVETTEMLDFLKEIVQAVPDPSAGGTIDLTEGKGEGGEKRKRGKGKKNANAGDDEAAGTSSAPTSRRRNSRKAAAAAAMRDRDDDARMQDEDDRDDEEEEEGNTSAPQSDHHGPSSGTVDEEEDWGDEDRPYIPGKGR